MLPLVAFSAQLASSSILISIDKRSYVVIVLEHKTVGTRLGPCRQLAVAITKETGSQNC